MDLWFALLVHRASTSKLQFPNCRLPRWITGRDYEDVRICVKRKLRRRNDFVSVASELSLATTASVRQHRTLGRTVAGLFVIRLVARTKLLDDPPAQVIKLTFHSLAVRALAQRLHALVQFRRRRHGDSSVPRFMLSQRLDVSLPDLPRCLRRIRWCRPARHGDGDRGLRSEAATAAAIRGRHHGELPVHTPVRQRVMWGSLFPRSLLPDGLTQFRNRRTRHRIKVRRPTHGTLCPGCNNELRQKEAAREENPNEDRTSSSTLNVRRHFNACWTAPGFNATGTKERTSSPFAASNTRTLPSKPPVTTQFVEG